MQLAGCRKHKRTGDAGRRHFFSEVVVWLLFLPLSASPLLLFFASTAELDTEPDISTLHERKHLHIAMSGTGTARKKGWKGRPSPSAGNCSSGNGGNYLGYYYSS